MKSERNILQYIYFQYIPCVFSKQIKKLRKIRKVIKENTQINYTSLDNYFEITIATQARKEISKCLEDLQIRD